MTLGTSSRGDLRLCLSLTSWSDGCLPPDSSATRRTGSHLCPNCRTRHFTRRCRSRLCAKSRPRSFLRSNPNATSATTTTSRLPKISPNTVRRTEIVSRLSCRSVSDLTVAASQVRSSRNSATWMRSKRRTSCSIAGSGLASRSSRGGFPISPVSTLFRSIPTLR